MLNYIWTFMILCGIGFGISTGNTKAVSEAILSSTQEAVELCITMTGIMAMWIGLMEIAKESGLIKGLTGFTEPVLSFLFPRLSKDHPAREYISANIIANILGLGWGATPAGLKAMEALAQPAEAGSQITQATNEMCTFLILNISSLQLIPVSIIAYRSQYASQDPTAVVGPGLIATGISTLAAVIFCKYMDRRTRK